MHRLPNGDVVRRFRIASLLYVAVWIFALMTIGCLGHEVLYGGCRFMIHALAGTAVALLLLVLVAVISSRLRCPLCMVQPLSNRGCSKHKKARKLLGSHRLLVAVTILLRDHFRCPYCGEPTAMEARRRK